MKALGLVVSDKKIFKNCILKTYFLTPWPTYATNWNGLNNFGRGPPRDHSCEVWSKSNEWFQRRSCLKKMLTHARTMDDGQWAITKAHLEHIVLRWAKKLMDDRRLTLCSGELKSVSGNPPLHRKYQQPLSKLFSEMNKKIPALPTYFFWVVSCNTLIFLLDLTWQRLCFLSQLLQPSFESW